MWHPQRHIIEYACASPAKLKPLMLVVLTLLDHSESKPDSDGDVATKVDAKPGPGSSQRDIRRYCWQRSAVTACWLVSAVFGPIQNAVCAVQEAFNAFPHVVRSEFCDP